MKRGFILNGSIFFDEIKAVVKSQPIWMMLGTQDIKLRYRRSAIGPFWITISMAITIYTMGFLYGYLFKVNQENYMPYLATGVIAWSFISTLIVEGSQVFVEAENYIRNQDCFMSIFIMRIILRNSIILLHNLLVFIPILFIYHINPGPQMLLLIPGVIFIGINAFLWGTLSGMLGARFRDFYQIITSLVQVVFFLTPIMWMTDSLPERLHWIVDYNPFNQFINLIRQPLLNHTISLHTLTVVTVISCIGFLIYACSMMKYKHRIVFWL